MLCYGIVCYIDFDFDFDVVVAVSYVDFVFVFVFDDEGYLLLELELLEPPFFEPPN